MRLVVCILAAATLAGCGNAPESNPSERASIAPEVPSNPRFGEAPSERQAREQIEARVGLGDYWVTTDVATENASPGGEVVNRVYYGQKFTVYEKRGQWYRTVEDGFTPRWTRASSLSQTQPAPKPVYSGPAEYQDNRIAPDAIGNPGEYGLTRADVDILRKGAKLVLQSRPDCSRITMADKSVSKPNTYYVTCEIGGSVENVFFTRAEAEAGSIS